MASAAALAAAAVEESQVDEELILSLTQQSQSQWRESLQHCVSALFIGMGSPIGGLTLRVRWDSV